MAPPSPFPTLGATQLLSRADFLDRRHRLHGRRRMAGMDHDRVGDVVGERDIRLGEGLFDPAIGFGADLELLTGRADLRLLPEGSYNAPGLADLALRASTELHIEPGTLALCFGYSTGNWAVANSAMRFIYNEARPVWSEVNRVTMMQLDLNQLPTDSISYLAAVLGTDITR